MKNRDGAGNLEASESKERIIFPESERPYKFSFKTYSNPKKICYKITDKPTIFQYISSFVRANLELVYL